MKKLVVSLFLVCCALLGVAFINPGKAFAAESSFTAAAASAAADKALADVPHVRSDQRAELLKAMERGDIVAQKAILQDIRAVSDTEEKLIKLRSSVSKLREQVAKCEGTPPPVKDGGDKCGAEAEAKVRSSIEDVKKSLKKHSGRLGRMQSSMAKVVEACTALEARMDKVETRLGVAERDITEIKANVKDVAAEAGKASATAERAEAKADMALMREDSVEFSSTFGFAARKGIGSAENALGFGFCGSSKASGFGGCAEVSTGFTGLFGGGQPAPTSAVLEVGPRWTIGSVASPLTAGIRGIIGFASKTRLSDERYAGMSGGVQGDLNFNLAKVSVLPLEVSLRGGQVWGMYEGWIAGINVAIDLGGTGKLLQ